MDTEIRNLPREAEINAQDVLKIVRRWKWPILGFVVVSTVAAGGAALVLPKRYEAITVISPVSSTPGEGQLGTFGAIASQLGGLASLAGLSVGADSKRFESLAILKSEALTERYIQQNNLLPVLYAKRWDSHTKRWKITDRTKTPTLWKANQYFQKHIRDLTTDNRTGIVTLTITWTDPTLAADWANGLVRMANDYLRNKAIAESERDIAYLNDQATKTDVVGAKQAIYTILENEINKEMLARGSDEYAFRVLDPAMPPERPSSPQPLLWTITAAIGSLVLSFVIAFVRAAWSARE